MTDREYEQSIRQQLSDLFNDGFTAFEQFKDNRPVYEMCVRQHLAKARMLSLMNTDMELLCKSIGLNFKEVVEEEYMRAYEKIKSIS